MTKNNNRAAHNKAIDAVLEELRNNIHFAEVRAEAKLDEMARVFADDKRPPAPATPIVKPTATKPSTKVFYPDSLFLNALTRDWQSPRQLHRKLIASGVSKGSIYARLQRLADDPASQVEGHDHNYRLKAPATPVAALTARSAPTMRKTRKAASGSGRKPPRMVRLTRPDDAIEVAREFWSKGVRVTLTIG